jgi:hypothetical protein
MTQIIINKMIAHHMDLDSKNPVLLNKTFDLNKEAECKRAHYSRPSFSN